MQLLQVQTTWMDFVFKADPGRREGALLKKLSFFPHEKPAPERRDVPTDLTVGVPTAPQIIKAGGLKGGLADLRVQHWGARGRGIAVGSRLI